MYEEIELAFCTSNMASAIVDSLKEELMKKEIENELQSMRKILEIEKECRLAEAMEMKDYFQQQADHFQGQASTSQARFTELEGKYKLLMSAGHRQSQSSATLMEACVRGDGEESKKTKTKSLVEAVGIDATTTPSTCEDDISSFYRTALLTSSSIQPESPLTHIMSKIYTYSDQYRYEGFMLAFDHINKYYICERCFRVLVCNVSNANLTNHSTRAICTGCSNETIMDSGEETSKLHSSFSMFSDSGITPKTIDTLPDLSAGFTGKGNFFAPVLCSTMASVEERTEEEEESSMEMSSILSRPNNTMVKK
ncbi:hypothetical protein B566_EDAN018267 [Ephemera danica]|nr:hypothetical protein B566_EDAN018267 [Ephemera danica]